MEDMDEEVYVGEVKESEMKNYYKAEVRKRKTDLFHSDGLSSLESSPASNIPQVYSLAHSVASPSAEPSSEKCPSPNLHGSDTIKKELLINCTPNDTNNMAYMEKGFEILPSTGLHSNSLHESFEDLRLVSIPTEFDFTLSPKKQSFVYSSPICKKEGIKKESLDLISDHSDHDINVIAAPCNYFEDENNLPCSNISFDKSGTEIMTVNVLESCVSESGNITNVSFEPSSQTSVVTDSVNETDTPFLSTIVLEGGKETPENSSVAQGNQTDCEYCSETSEEDLHSKTEEQNNLNKVPKKLPEFTEHQQNLLRQLWGSPQSSSPLMDALNLSTSSPEKALLKPEKSMLHTLDLSVDERIPVQRYVAIIQPTNLTLRKEELENIRPVEIIKRDFMKPPRNTPMKVISRKVGLINDPAHLHQDCNIKPKKFFKSLVPTSLEKQAMSSIPVSKTRIVQPSPAKLAKANAFNIYQSKPVRGLKFSPKAWQVESPVAKYIHEDPAQPLHRKVCAIEHVGPLTPTRVSKTENIEKNRKPERVQAVPAAKYISKLKATATPVEHAKIMKPSGRFFPSPRTPQILKHQGPRKFIKDSELIKPFSEGATEMSLDVSTVQSVCLKRSDTLFKPLFSSKK